MRPWVTPEQWTQNYYQPPTTNGYVGGLFSLQKPESSSAGNSNQPNDGSHKLIDLCSDDESEVRPSATAAPSTSTGPTTNGESGGVNAHYIYDGQQQPQQWNLANSNVPQPTIRHNVNGRPLTSQYVGNLTSSPSLGTHASQAQPAPANLAASYRNPTPPSSERNLRAEYLN